MKKPTIIIADDIPEIRMIFMEVLLNAKSEFIESEFFEAENGKEIITILEKKQVDIIFTDIEMPVMNGLDFIEYLRKQCLPPVCNIPAIAITSYNSKSFRQRCLNTGFDRVIAKPYSEKELLFVLRTFLTDI